jgi:hypothetical protein
MQFLGCGFEKPLTIFNSNWTILHSSQQYIRILIFHILININYFPFLKSIIVVIITVIPSDVQYIFSFSIFALLISGTVFLLTSDLPYVRSYTAHGLYEMSLGEKCQCLSTSLTHSNRVPPRILAPMLIHSFSFSLSPSLSWFHYIAQASLELMILLPQPPSIESTGMYHHTWLHSFRYGKFYFDVEYIAAW